MAILILLLALINYVNLATARAGRRAREIGVRKAVGAGRGQLMRQLLGESVLLCGLATALAAALAEAAMPLFPRLAGIDLSGLGWTPAMVLGGLALVAGLGTAAGLYPAWVLSRHEAATMARRGRSVGGAGLRRGLVVVQFTVTAALMTVTLVVWQQLDYIQTRRLGLQPERVVVLENGALPPEAAHAFKTELLRDHRITAVSLAQSMPTKFTIRMGFQIDGTEVRMSSYQVDADFVEAMGMRLQSGRFLRDDPADDDAIVLNEAAVRMLGWDEPLSRTFAFHGVERHVVGVVEDFHYESLHRPVEPLYMVPPAAGSATRRSASGRATPARACGRWSRPGRPSRRITRSVSPSSTRPSGVSTRMSSGWPACSPPSSASPSPSPPWGSSAWRRTRRRSAPGRSGCARSSEPR